MGRSKIKKYAKMVAPPLLVDGIRLVSKWAKPTNGQRTDVVTSVERPIELIDHYSNTSLFALEVLRGRGRIEEMRLLSLGTRTAHLADYVGVFRKTYHCTTVDTPFPIAPDSSECRFEVLQQDIFDLNELDVDCVISQAMIHCLNDSRYGNSGSDRGWQRPYGVAEKLRSILPGREVSVIVSIAVNHDELLVDNNAHLSHVKFLKGFVDAGFRVDRFFFDYLSWSFPRRPEYFAPEYRRAPELPPVEAAASEHDYVIGNYLFTKC